MAYYMTCETKKGIYEPIDIQTTNLFMRTSKNRKGCSLEEIDHFTMQFADLDELKEYLLSYDLLSLNNYGRELSTRNLFKGEYKKVPYGFLFNHNKKFIDDPWTLIFQVYDRVMSHHDYQFLRSLAEHYRKFYDCADVVYELNQYAKMSATDGVLNKGMFIRDENNDTPLLRMLKELAFEHDKRNYGKITYHDTIQYRNLHDLAAFYEHYYNNKAKDALTSDPMLYRGMSEIEVLPDFKGLVYEVADEFATDPEYLIRNYYVIKKEKEREAEELARKIAEQAKGRKLKKGSIFPGQMSFFDFNDDDDNK